MPSILESRDLPGADRLLRCCACVRASGAGIGFEITIESRMSSAGPIRSFVVINPRTAAHETEEDVTRGPDDDSRVSSPYHQIAGLRVLDTPKAVNPIVEIVGVRIGVLEPGPFVNGMNQVGAVVAGVSTHFRIERGRDDGQPFVWSERPVEPSFVTPARGRSRRGLRRQYSGPVRIEGYSTEQGRARSFRQSPHDSIVMRDSPPREITVVHV